MAIALKNSARLQPQQGAQIDWANPITRGLAFCHVQGQNGSVFGFTSGGNSVTAYNAATLTNTPLGRGVQTSSFLYDTGTTPMTGTAYSLLMAGNCMSTSAIQNALDDDNDTGSPRCFQFRINASKAELITFDTSNNPYFATATAMSAGKLAAGFVMGASVAGNNIAVFQNGAKTANTAGGTQRQPTGNTRVGGHKGAGGSAWSSGGMVLAAGWSRTLSDSEQQALADNPWQLFKGPVRRLWVVAPATGGNAVTPDTGVLTLTGLAPTVAKSANQSVTPGTAALSITGFAPLIAQPIAVSPATGTLSVTGFAPSIAQPQAVNPGVGILTIASFAPTVSQNITTNVNPGTGVLTLAGFAPSVAQTFNQTVSPGVGSLAITGFSPSITQPQGVTAGTGQLTISGLAPTVSQGLPTDPRYGRPRIDISAGAWLPSTGTSLSAMIGESVPSASDYAYTDSVSSFEVRLNPVTDPGTSSGQAVRYQIWTDDGGPMTVHFLQGAVEIASWVHASTPMSATVFEQFLTATQCDSITDYSNLRFKFEAL